MVQLYRIANDILKAIIAVTWGEQNESSAASRVPFDFLPAYLYPLAWAHF